MVQGEATLVVDLGNSSTKVCVMFGKDKNNKYRERTFELSNVFAPLPEGYEISSDYNTVSSTVLRVDSSVGHSLNGLYCNGELQKRERADTMIKPSAQSRKWEISSTILSLRLAFLRAHLELMKMNRVSDYHDLVITWKVIGLLPPGDFNRGREPMINLIQAVKTVDSTFPMMHLDINISSVQILPEGLGAYIAVVFDKGNIVRENYGYLREETVLVIDIGGGTTDCVVIKDNAIIQDSKYTISTGGNNVLQLVRRYLLSEEGLKLDENDIKEGILRGYVKDGALKVDIKKYINEARQEISAKIVSEFNNYLDGTTVKIRSIGYVLFCGGGSMSESEHDGIISLQTGVLNNLKEVAPNISIVEPPLVTRTTSTEDGMVEKNNVPMEAKMLNLIGASIMAELM